MKPCSLGTFVLSVFSFFVALYFVFSSEEVQVTPDSITGGQGLD